MAPIVYGFIAPRLKSNFRKRWNDFFREKKLDAVFDFYRTMNEKDLELRMSEMFHLERGGYIVGEKFQTAVLPLLDTMDVSAREAEKVNVIVNDGGVLVGLFVPEGGGEWFEAVLDLWKINS